MVSSYWIKNRLLKNVEIKLRHTDNEEIKGIDIIVDVLLDFSAVDVTMLGTDVDGKVELFDDCSVFVVGVVEVEGVTVS